VGVGRIHYTPIKLRHKLNQQRINRLMTTY
jgi:hypothetical protein